MSIKRLVLTAGVTEPLDRQHVPVTKAASKTAKEYKWKNMTSHEQSEFRKAMDKEWKSFLDLSAVTIIRKKDTHAIPPSRILPTRFILTNKDDSGTGLICKARLVCGGHLDPDISLLRTDAPTADTLGVNLVFCLLPVRSGFCKPVMLPLLSCPACMIIGLCS